MSVHSYPLVNKMVKLFGLREGLSKNFFSSLQIDSFTKPFITISREPGSGGAPIAKLLANKLGFKFFDKQIIEDIAQSTRKRSQIIKAVDEKSRTSIENIIHANFNPEYISDIKYMRALAQVVLTYACQGHCVILGRGGNLITPFAKGLHVRITAPYNIRVQRAMDYENHDQATAKKIIAKIEKDRRNFIKQYFRIDPKKPNAYDLTLNTASFDINQSADIILEAFYRKFSRLERYKSLLQK